MPWLHSHRLARLHVGFQLPNAHVRSHAADPGPGDRSGAGRAVSRGVACTRRDHTCRRSNAGGRHPVCQDPSNPLSLDEVIAKHRSIVAGVVDESTDDAILEFIVRLETKPDFSELTRILKRFVLLS
jgi:hypothetical protein